MSASEVEQWKNDVEENDDENFDEEDDGDDSDIDIDAEALEMARRLEAEISALDHANGATAPPADVERLSLPSSTPAHSQPDVVSTVRRVLDLIRDDTVATQTMMSTSAHGGTALYTAIADIAVSGDVKKGTAKALRQAVMALLRSSVLFGTRPRKRKRAVSDEPATTLKRAHVDIEHLVVQAVHTISQVLAAPSSDALDSSAILTLKDPLRHVFAFSVTCTTNDSMTRAIQEVSGLIQLFGALGGIQFAVDGAEECAVFPCREAGCVKIFTQVVDLQRHLHAHTGETLSSSAEGELSVDILQRIRMSVISLHPILQAQVVKGVLPSSGSVGGSDGRPTLVSTPSATHSIHSQPVHHANTGTSSTLPGPTTNTPFSARLIRLPPGPHLQNLPPGVMSSFPHFYGDTDYQKTLLDSASLAAQAHAGFVAAHADSESHVTGDNPIEPALSTAVKGKDGSASAAQESQPAL